MGKYFEALNLTECNDALMGWFIIQSEPRGGWLPEWWHFICAGGSVHTRTHTHWLPQSSSLNVHMWVIFVNYHRNKDGKDQILQKWHGTACAPCLCDTAWMKCCLLWREQLSGCHLNQHGITGAVMGVWKQEVGLLESRHPPCLRPLMLQCGSLLAGLSIC